jgi:hypothetical protein
MGKKVQAQIAATEIWQEKYSNAQALFVCGSIIRGEDTAFSDLDLVVIYDKVDYAFRESYLHKGWPVEAFIHDLGTLKYFFYELDAKSGFPSLPQMVSEGIVIPRVNEFTDSLKQLARTIINAGPPDLSPLEIDRRRYGITDLLDDIREPRNSAELIATGAELFETLADYYFRSNGLWSAQGKTICRRFQAINPDLGERYQMAFQELFGKHNPQACLKLAEEILNNSGGLLFEGYKLNAPASWRIEKPVNHAFGH